MVNYTMLLKVALISAAIAQLIAAFLALRINLRYRIYSAWFFLSASACVGAILRLNTLSHTWQEPPTFATNGPLWLTALASLLASILLLAGMSLIEPFFEQIAQAEQALRSEHRQLTSIVKETEAELQLAQRIQQHLLPAEPPKLPGVDIFGKSLAAEWTSGDYFDYLTLRDGTVAVVIADVSGHGLGPALLMSSTRASFRGLAPSVADVGELLTYGNRAVVDSVSEREFVTSFATRYNASLRAIDFAGAGHNAYLMRCDGSSQMLAADGPPLGIVPDLKISTSQQSDIRTGDILILVTDGILESRNARGEMFGEKRLLESVEKSREHSAALIVAELIQAARSFSENQLQEDDITAVVMKFA
jgi:sigma-B regulation protein RsbU (phosphoserine phosphatase)